MKKLLLLTAILTALYSNAQSKRDNTITLKGGDISFLNLAKELANTGFEIDNMNEGVGQLSTKFARIKNFNQSSRVRIQFNRDSITAQGVIRMDKKVSGVWEKGQEEIAEFTGPEKSAHKYTFNRIKSFLILLSEKYKGQVTYSMK